MLVVLNLVCTLLLHGRLLKVLTSHAHVKYFDLIIQLGYSPSMGKAKSSLCIIIIKIEKC